MATAYNIKVFSQRNSVILIFSLLIIFIGGVFLFIPQGLSKGMSVLVTILSMTITFLLWQKFVTGITEWAVDYEGLKMKWIKRIPLTTHEEINLKWGDIININYIVRSDYQIIKIQTKSGEEIKFFHHDATARDDYKVFTHALKQTFAEKEISSQ